MTASEKLKELDGAAHAAPWKATGPNEWDRLELKGIVKDWIKVTRYNVSHHSEGPIPGWFGLAETAGGSPQFGADAELIAALRNALPLIADCIEAAEDVARILNLHGSPLPARLTALQEALNGSAGDGGVT